MSTTTPTPPAQPDPDLLALLESMLPLLERLDAIEGCPQTLQALRQVLKKTHKPFKVGLTPFRLLSEAKSYALDLATRFPDQHVTVRYNCNDDIVATYHQGAETSK